ncbi:MAG: type II secretion system major pseudopilin GspG [Spirochaeta sp.]
MKRRIFQYGAGGFTFVETIIVIGIIMILTGSVGFSAIGFLDRARNASARTQIELYSAALQAYYLDTGVLPTREQGLQALWQAPTFDPVPHGWRGPYIDRPLQPDPWGHHFEYRIPGKEGMPFEISSPGMQQLNPGEASNGRW